MRLQRGEQSNPSYIHSSMISLHDLITFALLSSNFVEGCPKFKILSKRTRLDIDEVSLLRMIYF